MNTGSLIWRSGALCLILAGGACGKPPAPLAAPKIRRVSREGAALWIALERSVDAARLERPAPSGNATLQRWTFTRGARRVLRLEPPPPPGQYDLRLITASGAAWVLPLRVPEPAPHGLRARLALPFGAAPAEDAELGGGVNADGGVGLPVEAAATLALSLENESTHTVEAAVTLEIPKELRAGRAEARKKGWSLTERARIVRLEQRLRLEPGGQRQVRLPLRPRLEAAGRVLEVSATIGTGAGGRIVRKKRVRCVRAEALRQRIRITGLLLPTDGFGHNDPARRRDVLPIPTRLGERLRAWMGRPASGLGGEQPFTYQAVRIVNHSDTALAVDLRATVRAPGGTAPERAFLPPPGQARPGGIHAEPAWVPARTERSIVLPVYVRSGVLPGAYRRRVELRLFGSDALITAREEPLWVERTGRPPLYFTLLAVLILLVALPLLIWRARPLLGRFQPVELVQMALFGAAAFVLVGLPSKLLGTALFAALPIFSPFLLGLYNETGSALIAAALFVLIPRPGVALLAGSVRFLLNGVVLGALSPAEFLYAVPTLLAMEALLWLTGVTRKQRTGAPRMALAFAGFGLFSAGLVLSLEMTLYRLFYASWYILLYLLLNGLFYPALGGVLGARLGTALRRTAE